MNPDSTIVDSSIFLGAHDARRYPICPDELVQDVGGGTFDRVKRVAELFKRDCFWAFIGEQKSLCVQLIPVFIQAHRVQQVDDGSLAKIARAFASKGVFAHESMSCDLTLFAGDDPVNASRDVLYMRFPMLRSELSDHWTFSVPNRAVAIAVYNFVHRGPHGFVGTWADLRTFLDFTAKPSFLKPLYEQAVATLDAKTKGMSNPSDLLELESVLTHFSDETQSRLRMQTAISSCLQPAAVTELTWAGERHLLLAEKDLYLLQRGDGLGRIFRDHLRGISLSYPRDPARMMLGLQTGAWCQEINSVCVELEHVGSDFGSIRQAFPNLSIVYVARDNRSFTYHLEKIEKLYSNVVLRLQPGSRGSYVGVKDAGKILTTTIPSLVERNVRLEVQTPFDLDFHEYFSQCVENRSPGFWSTESGYAWHVKEITELFQKLMPINMTIRTELPGKGPFWWRFEPSPGKYADTIEVVIDDSASSSG